MSATKESVVRQFLASLEDGDLDKVLRFVSDDAVFEDPRGIQQGIEAIKTGFGTEFAMTPDLRSTVQGLVAAGGTAMVERVDSFGVGATRVSMDVVGVFEVDSNGLITRWREYFDQKSLADDLAAAGATISE
jgi:limonene-1,2-epoxide hydrolase